ncbi:MAG TPA: hypothetical protein PKW59_11725 [Thermotogota bacterium]|nr:hypothetical protein [Thermotogota bacterium]
MKKALKISILVSLTIFLFVSLSAVSCIDFFLDSDSDSESGSGSNRVTYKVTVNNTARSTYVTLYIDGSYEGTISAKSSKSFSGIERGSSASIKNNSGDFLQFSGGSYEYSVYSNVTFSIPAGGTWAIAERE